MAVVLLTPDRAADPMSQFFRGTIDREMDAHSIMCHRDWRPPLQPGLHHATLITALGFVSGLVRQVNLHARDLRAKMVQSIFDHITNVRIQRLVTVDIVTSINLDLHHQGLSVICRQIAMGQRPTPSGSTTSYRRSPRRFPSRSYEAGARP